MVLDKVKLKTINNKSIIGDGNIAIDVSCGGSTVIFEDDCSSVSGLSNYGSSVLIRGTNAIATISYDSTDNCYALTGSGNYHSAIPIPVLNDKDNYSIEADFKCGYNNELTTIGFVVRDYNDTSIQSTSFQLKGNGTFRKMNYTIGLDKDYTDEIISYSPYTYWVHMRLEITGASVKVELSYDGTIFKTYNYTTETITNRQVGLFLFCERGSTNSKCWVKNIKAEYLCESSTTIFEDGGVTGNVNTDYVTSHSGVSATVSSTGTTVSSTTYADCYYIANVLLPKDWIAEFTIVSVNAFGGIGFLNSSKAIQWSVEYNLIDSPKGLEWRVGSTTQWISNDYTMPSTIKLKKQGTSLEIYLNNTLIATETITDITGYLGWKTHSHSSRSVTFKDFVIRRYCQTDMDSENTIYLGDDIMTMIDTALEHIITNWQDYE